MEKFQYRIKEGLLKGKGYEFQKLYAHDYKSYRKKIDGYTIWLWSKGKSIEINDWYQNTHYLLKFFKENINHPSFDELDMWGKPKEYLKVQMNPETGEVQFHDIKAYLEVFKTGDWTEWTAKYGNWHNEILLKRPALRKVLEEINSLDPTISF